MSRTQYQKTYLTTYAIFSKLYPNAQPLPLINATLQLRKSRQIPSGASPEVTLRTSEQWTFSIYVAALACSIGFLETISDAKGFVRTILNEHSLDWLDSDIGHCLIQTCVGTTSVQTPIRELLMLAERIIASEASSSPNSDRSEAEEKFIRGIEEAIAAGDLKINVPRAHVHIFHSKIVVEESYMRSVVSADIIDLFRTIVPIYFIVVGKKKTTPLNGYCWESELVFTQKLTTNYRLQQIHNRQES